MILYILLMAHFLADFTFQTTKLAQRKFDQFKYLICHAFIYAAVFLVTIFPFIEWNKAIMPYSIIVFSHFFIDWIRKLVDKKFRRKSILFASFILDQVLHVIIIVVSYYAFALAAETTRLYAYIQQWPHFNNIVIYSLTFVILWDPAAIFIQKLFSYIIDRNSNDLEENDPQAGRIIGKLERIIISVLILCNQFGAIGFVLTAKSIARFKQLEDKNFAEKYLVGTLASVTIAFITTIVLKELSQ